MTMTLRVVPGAEADLSSMERFDFSQLLNAVRVYGKDIPDLEIWADPRMGKSEEEPFGRSVIGIELHFRRKVGTRLLDLTLVLSAATMHDCPQLVMNTVGEWATRALGEAATL